MLLRIYNEWIHKFHPQLKHQQVNPNDPSA
jgi:hypothetical protein